MARTVLAVAAFALLDCATSPLFPAQDGGADGGPDAGVDGGADGGLDGGLPVTGACTMLNNRRCDYLARCGLIAPGEQARRDCVAYFTATWCGPTKWLSRVEPAIATLRYDAVKAQACADSFGSRACTDWSTEPDPCTRFLLPNAQTRQHCYDDYPECIEGVCRGAACPRTCQPRGGKDEVCRFDADCRSGLYCRQSMTTAGVGACTDFAALDAGCDTAQLCSEGLACIDAHCEALPKEADPCRQGRCDETSFCVSSPDGGVCVARRNAAAGCSDDVQCLSGLICEDLSHRCDVNVLTQQGAACGPRQTCSPPYSCVGRTAQAPGDCQTPRMRGQRCVSSADCQADLACNQGDGGSVCGPRRLPSQYCDDTRDCVTFTQCLVHACTPIPIVGAACDGIGTCLWGACVDIGDGGLVCDEPQGPGARCTRPADCASNRCEQGSCLAACTP